MRTTTPNSEVIVVLDGKPVKGTIADVLSQGAARVQLGGDKGSVQASYSLTGEEGTFHYPDETKAVKESDTFGEPPPVPPGAALADEAAETGNKKSGKKA